MSTTAKVLIIDDDSDFLTSVQALLEGEGYEVLAAKSGRQGIDLINSADPDLVVCDVMMETPTEGYAVSGAVKFNQMAGNGVPFIMVSSIEQNPDELFPRSEELGAIRPDAYLTKPLDIPVFLETVSRVVRRKLHI